MPRAGFIRPAGFLLIPRCRFSLNAKLKNPDRFHSKAPRSYHSYTWATVHHRHEVLIYSIWSLKQNCQARLPFLKISLLCTFTRNLGSEAPGGARGFSWALVVLRCFARAGENQLAQPEPDPLQCETPESIIHPMHPL